MMMRPPIVPILPIHSRHVETQSKILLAALLLVLAAPLQSADKLVAVLEARPGAEAAPPAPVLFWQEVRKDPRALHIYCLRADLTAKELEAAVLIAAAPDGPGPATAVLEKPAVLAARPGVVAAVNANFFKDLPPPGGEKPGRPYHYAGRPVNICGWAKDGTREASPPQAGYPSFWTDASGRGCVGTPAAPAEASMAVSGYKELVRDGKTLIADAQPLHPRTALGLDAAGKTLWLVVVDGRQAGYSEGMSLGELATLLKDLGCWSALNLDGGGSAIMLVAAHSEKLEVVNRPSDASTRPIPVMLAIRAKLAADEHKGGDK
ncbi:MAG: phosphodiester glycosidase family protein [Planctomycetota bacterium]